LTLLALYRDDAEAMQAPSPGCRTAGGADPWATEPPQLVTDDPHRIRRELGERGIRFERWSARSIAAGTAPADGTGEGLDQEAILARYAEEIARLRADGGYPTVDAIRMTPDHPDREALRRTFLAEHTHSEDEVRFFVEGRGLFCLHLGDEVLQLLCEAGDWIAVPAGTPHWFDMGSAPAFCALRFFGNSEGWVARFTGSAIAGRYPLLEAFLDASRRPAVAIG
jgi:1,2-dihydroxy-3-keto-5-methylthiopentene dioxygenase